MSEFTPLNLKLIATKDEPLRDYSITGANSAVALKKGLVNADWYHTPIERDTMNHLLERSDYAGIRDTFIWFSILIGSGILGAYTWGTIWTVIPFLIYGVIYATTSDSRWHECSHGTAFKSDWMNNVLYEIASFMVFRESTPWRWSHQRHHSDTIIIGSDPEIVNQKPFNPFKFILGFSMISATWATIKNMILHSFCKLRDAEKSYIPDYEYSKVYFKARIYLLIYASVIGLAIYTNSWLPLMYIGLPTFYGSWLMPIYGITQHAGLAENVLDHRLNCRTVHMNLINRYLYWNMGYHVEHHMYPLVPYHQLPKLHKEVLHDMPKPYASLYEAWKEIIPVLFIQIDNPNYYVNRPLPETANPSDYRHHCAPVYAIGEVDSEGWIQVDAKVPSSGNIIRFDHEENSYAIYCNSENELFATDGICTHGNSHLTDGMIIGDTIECAKHNGRFSYKDGSCKRKPVDVPLKTHPVKLADDKLFFKLNAAGGAGASLENKTKFKVVSNSNVATFIKELVLEPVDDTQFTFNPGEYIQIEVPAYQFDDLSHFQIDAPYINTWNEQELFSGFAKNDVTCKRNYSLANNPRKEKELRFNIRIATAPKGENVSSGIGSSWVFGLKEGDEINAFGPYGDFHIKASQNEMIYVGGGAGMAPLRSHISHLFETLATDRKVSFWYGARSLKEVFYQEYFLELEKRFENFSFHLALSENLTEDNWSGPCGFIHNVLENNYIKSHDNPDSVEFYLCGPPAMVQATQNMLNTYKVSNDAIAFDEF